MLGNASPLEIGLFIASMLGIVKAVGLKIDAWKDLLALDPVDRMNSPSGKLAWARIWTDAYAIYVFAVFAWLGGRAMTLPPTDADRNGLPDIVSLLILLAFLGIVVFLLALVFYLSWTRHNVEDFIPPPEAPKDLVDVNVSMQQGGTHE